MKTVLVAGSGRSLNDQAELAARLVGRGLAKSGFALVTGCWKGVDEKATNAFLGALQEDGISPVGRYTQVFHRGAGNLLMSSKVSDARLRFEVGSDEVAYIKARDLCQAGILIGGLGGTKHMAFELIGSGRPVFPLPLTGGDAMDAYGEILQKWEQRQIPWLTRTQFLGLSLPLVGDANHLMRLLSAALSNTAEVFISYRRDDVPGVAGRIAADLREHLGPLRVFLDMHSIEPGCNFDSRIRDALEQCRAVICLIGPRWNVERLSTRNDVVRYELETALQLDKPIVPVVAFSGELPMEQSLPNTLKGLVRHNAVFVHDNATYEDRMNSIIKEIDRLLAGRA